MDMSSYIFILMAVVLAVSIIEVDAACDGCHTNIYNREHNNTATCNDCHQATQDDGVFHNVDYIYTYKPYTSAPCIKCHANYKKSIVEKRYQ